MCIRDRYQVVDPKWSFVVSCDWQCRPQDEQTTVGSAVPRPTQVKPPAPSKALDEKDAQIGLYQIVAANWYFAVTCDWQCRPEGEELPQQELPFQELPPQQEDVGEVPQPPARTRCNVPLSDSDARIGLYQLVDYRWGYVASCEWQCKPSRQRKSTARQPAAKQPAKPSAARESALRESTVRPSDARQSSLPAGRESSARESAVRESRGPSKPPVGDADGVPLSETEARLGLYQVVHPGWTYVVSCDWQCRPAGEKVYDETTMSVVESGPGAVEPAGRVALSESAARLGLYQLVSGRWGWLVSCDWQCRPLGEPAGYQPDHDAYSQGLSEDLDHERGLHSTSSLSSCREDDRAVGRLSLFTQTGEIVMTLVGDEGEAGLVALDEEGQKETRISPDVAFDEQEAKQRKRELAQLVRELAQDVSMLFRLHSS